MTCSDINKTSIKSLRIKFAGYLNKSNNNVNHSIIKPQCVGLRKYCHISPLLRATGVIPVSDFIVNQCLDLCKNCVLSDSIASDFYCELLSANIQTAKNRTLIGRAMNYVTGHNFTVLDYIFSIECQRNFKQSFKTYIKPRIDGITDTIHMLLLNCDKNDNQLLNMKCTSI